MSAGAVLTYIVLWLMRALARLPLPVLRALGSSLGWALWVLVAQRRRVVLTNLGLCFPGWSAQRRIQVARAVFRRFGQTWLDRAWLWHAPEPVLRRRLRLEGEVAALTAPDPALLDRSGRPVTGARVLFAPHFMGLDAGWTALALHLPRRLVTIYTDQSNPVMDAWIRRGRERLGQVQLFGRADGVAPVVAALRAGDLLYLLPDMNFGPHESLWVPFYGVMAATVPSLSRFARLGRAPVHSVVTRLAPHGYTVQIGPAWVDYPSADLLADTARMNRELQALIDPLVAEYYWVHKRFKDRPAGEPQVYH